MFGFGILSGLTFLPLVGVAILLVLRGDDEATLRNVRWVALLTTLVTFAVSLVAWSRFDTSSAAFQLVEQRDWFSDKILFKFGVDGISMPFVLLTAFLMPFCIAASWVSITYRVRDYMIAFLVLESLMLGVFTALDLMLFYLFFEAGLIPMFLIIGVWGGKRRIYASFKFFLYTLLGSVLMLLAIMAMYWTAGTTDIVVLLKTSFPAGMQKWLWLAFFASFAVKMPMWPVHTWLPDAHVEAPTAGSVILAGILLKMGGYGFLRFSLPMFPDASHYFAPMVFQGVQGAVYQMVSHGLVAGALFLCVGVVYDRMHTRDIAAYGGLVNRMPRYAVVMLIFTMANVGLPGTSGFVGEFLTLIGTYKANSSVALFATLGVILSATYALYLYRRVIFGVLDKPSLLNIADLDGREMAMLVPLVLLTLYYGIHPQPILDACAASVDQLIKGYDVALQSMKTAALAVH